MLFTCYTSAACFSPTTFMSTVHKTFSQQHCGVQTVMLLWRAADSVLVWCYGQTIYTMHQDICIVMNRHVNLLAIPRPLCRPDRGMKPLTKKETSGLLFLPHWLFCFVFGVFLAGRPLQVRGATEITCAAWFTSVYTSCEQQVKIALTHTSTWVSGLLNPDPVSCSWCH